MFDYIEVVNFDTNERKIVEELTDKLFYEGFRCVGYVSNSKVDYPEMYAQQQEEALINLQGSSMDPMISLSEPDISGESIYWTPVEIY